MMPALFGLAVSSSQRDAARIRQFVRDYFARAAAGLAVVPPNLRGYYEQAAREEAAGIEAARLERWGLIGRVEPFTGPRAGGVDRT